MTQIDCSDIKAILSPYIDDELDEPTRHLAERHLGRCAACRELVDQAERLDVLVAREAEAATPAGLSPDFFGGVMARTVYADPPRLTRRRIAMWTGWLAAAAAIAMAAGIWIDQNVRPVAQVAANENTGPPAPSEQATEEQPSVAEGFYLTGLDLTSQAFEGALPSNTFAFASSPVEAESSGGGAEAVAAGYDQSEGMPIADEASMAQVLTPQPVVVPAAREHRAVVTAASYQLDVPPIDREDAEALYTASILMHLLVAADGRSFSDIENVRQVVEVDDLLPRLTEARQRLEPEDRPAVFAAESVLTRVSQGPLDSNDVRSLRETVARLNLSDELSEITHRWDRGTW